MLGHMERRRRIPAQCRRDVTLQKFEICTLIFVVCSVNSLTADINNPQIIVMNYLYLSVSFFPAHTSGREKWWGPSKTSIMSTYKEVLAYLFPSRYFVLSSSKTMKYRRSGFLSAFVVSWCASAYHLSAALEGFSGTSRMSLRTLRALLSHTVFSSDRFLITLFACTALLARTRQQTKPSVWRRQCAQSPTYSYAVLSETDAEMELFLKRGNRMGQTSLSLGDGWSKVGNR